MSRIDPNIALGVKTPQPNDALETYGKVLQMRNLLDQGRIGRQNIEMNDENLRRAGLENQQRERLQKGQQYENEMIRANTNLNEDGSVFINHDFVEGALTRAGYPDLAKKHNEERSAIAKNERDRVEGELKNHATKVTQLGKMSQSILNASPDLRPGLYSFAIKQALSAGLIDQNMLKEIPAQYDGEKTDAMLQEMADHAAENPAEAMYKRMQETRAKETQAAELPGKKAEALKKQVEVESTLLGGAKDQASWTQALAQLPEDRRKLYATEYTPEAGHQAALMGLTAKERAALDDVSNINELALKAAKGDKDAKRALDILQKREIDIDTAKQLGGLGATLGPGAKVPMTVNAGPDDSFLSGLPSGAQAVVKGLTDYRLPLPTGMALRTGYWQKMLELASQYDPSFDVKEYGARQKLLSSFKAGQDADNIKSINTAISHLGRLMKSGAALKNWEENAIGPFTTLANAINNAVKSGTGSQILKQFKIDRSAVKSELTRAFRGTGGSVDDVKNWEDNFNENSASNSLQNGGQETVELLAGRLKSVKDKFVSGMGKQADFNILTPESRKILKQLGIDSNTIEPEIKSVAAPPPAAGGDKVITPELIAQARAKNKGVSDDELIKGFEARGYKKP